MMIKNIRIRNFRSLRDVNVDLGPTNVLVGPNMSGKSNFIDVFRFLVDLLTPVGGVQGLNNAIMRRNGFQEIAWKGENESNIIELVLDGTLRESDTDESHRWTYELELLGERRYGNVRVQREVLTLFTPNGPILLIETLDGNRILHEEKRKAISQVSDSNRLALEYEFPDWKGNEIRAAIAMCRFYRLLPPLMRQANPSAAVQVLAEHGDNLASWLLLIQTRHNEAFRRMVNACREVFPDLEEVLSWPTQQSTVFIASREKYLSTPTTVWQMSDGELAFIALLSLVFAPSELGAPIYCVEEPENYLHPRLLTVLAELLRQVQLELGPTNSAQLIISTHSPLLIDKSSIDDLILFRRKRGATECVRPSSNENFRKLVDSGEIGLGELYYSGALSRA